MENKMKIDTDEDKILREQATIITDNTLKMIDEEDAMIINTNKKVEENEKKIHFLYFTNPGRTNLLEMSLKSIERVKHKCMGTVFIYTNHFPSKELSTLEEDVKSYNLDLDIKIINRRYFQGYYGGLGIKDFNPEMRVYLEINEEIGKDDWICQINTDILMLSNSIFDKVLTCKQDLVGHPCINNNHKYVQGGIYFIRSSIIPSMIDLSFYEMAGQICSAIRKTTDKCPEDALITNCISKVGKVKYIENMQLDSNNIDKINKHNLNKFAKISPTIHFRTLSRIAQMKRICELLKIEITEVEEE